MSQRKTHKEQIQYFYDNQTWLYDYVYAFFYGFVLNDNYTYDAKTSETSIILPLMPYTYDTFGNRSYDYDYFSNVNKLILQSTYSSISLVRRGVFLKHTASEQEHSYVWTANASSSDIRFKFTGKERDSETGFDYFGARYLDSELSIWLSVDPLASDFPSVSAYMYTNGNPINMIDPDGRWPKKIHNEILMETFKSMLDNGQITKKQFRYLKKGSKKADRPRYQQANDSPRHSMLKPGQSAEDGIEQREEFVSNTIKASNEAKGERKKWILLGMAMHAKMDETSPTHTDRNDDGTYTPIENDLGSLFNPKNWSKWKKHIKGEQRKDLTPTLMNDSKKFVMDVFNRADVSKSSKATSSAAEETPLIIPKRKLILGSEGGHL